MSRKILSLTVIILMSIGSFGAFGLEYSIEKKDINQNEIYKLRQEAKEKGWTFKIGQTPVSDRNIEKLCGFVAPENWSENARFNLIEPSISLPPSFDWREQGGVTPVKDQGNCGSCWAFGTVAPLESAIKIKEGKTVDLSEQWLVSCNKDYWGCDGGWWAHDYHEWKKGSCGGTGAVLESDFSYSASDESCNGPYQHPYILENWAFIGSEYGTPVKSAIKQAIIDYGPVSASVRATSDWNYYNGGVYNNDAVGRVNHAITIVGWDDAMGSNGVWIIKNSWGSGWGDNGYMYIEYGCSSIGYSACYVDDYRGPPHENEEIVTFNLKELTNDPNQGFDRIEPWGNKPEWYYRIGATISGETYYRNNYNMWWEDIGNLGFYSEYTWNPNDIFEYITDSSIVEFTIKLMDDDQFFLEGYKDDLADVSAYPGGGVDQDTSDHRPSIYHGSYDLITDELTGDETSDPDSEGFCYTVGDGINNAKVWFKITDTYNGELYTPELDVSPKNIDFGKRTGGTHSDTFTIENIGTYDENEWQKLEWTATDNKDWISVNPKSGSLNGGAKETVTVTINAGDLSEGDHSGKISILSNGGSDEVIIQVNKEKTKSLNKIFLPNLIKETSLLLRYLISKIELFYPTI